MWPLLLLATVAVTVTSIGGSAGGYTARVVNTADTVQSGSLLAAGATGGATECDTSGGATVTTANTAACTGALLGPASGPLPATGTTAVTTTVTDKGSLPAASAKITETSCGTLDLLNQTTATNPLLVRGDTIAYAQPGPFTGGGMTTVGLGLNGSSGYAADVTSSTNPQNFTETIWFKTTSTSGGVLMGFSNVPSNTTATNSDRIIWVDPSGKVVFGIVTILGVQEVTSVSAYNNGAWHEATATSSALGMTLTVDGGTAVAKGLSTGPNTYNGYWHDGWDNMSVSAWTDAPTDVFFSGSLADAVDFPSVLSAAQITALYGTGPSTQTQANWATTIAGDGAANSWIMGDSGTTYAGGAPLVTPLPCTLVDVTIATTSLSAACAAPSGTGACPTPSSTTTLASLAAAGTTALAVSGLPTPTRTLTLTFTDALDAGSNAYAIGLHVLAPLSFNVDSGVSYTGFSATLTWLLSTVEL